MAIAIDQATLGTNSEDTTATTIALTTTGAVAAGATMIIVAFWEDVAVTGVSGGGLTWTLDKVAVTSETDEISISSAYAPAGLASSTELTVTGASTTMRMVCGFSLLGVKSSGRIDGTPVSASGGTQAWATPSYTITSGSWIVGAVGLDTEQTNTVTAPSVELFDIQHPSAVRTRGLVAGYRTSTGTFAGSLDSFMEAWAAIAVAYLTDPPHRLLTPNALRPAAFAPGLAR